MRFPNSQVLWIILMRILYLVLPLRYLYSKDCAEISENFVKKILTIIVYFIKVLMTFKNIFCWSAGDCILFWPMEFILKWLKSFFFGGGLRGWGWRQKKRQSGKITGSLTECEVPIVVPHIKPIVELCMALAGEASLEDPLRYSKGTVSRDQ